MNTTVNPRTDALSQFAAAQYPRGRTQADDEDATASRARQRLSLGSVLRPFVGYGSAFLSKLWQAIVAIVRQVGRVFGVQADISETPPLDPSAAAATFTAEGDSPEDQARVDAAAKATAQELVQKSQEIGRLKLNPKILQSEGSEAYAALHLDEAGSNLQALRQMYEGKDGELRVFAEGIALKTGASANSVLAYLKGGALDDPGAAGRFPAAVLDLTREVLQLDSAVKEMELSYCAMAVDAIGCAKEMNAPALESLVRQRSAKHATQEMNSLICEEVERVVLPKFASQGLKSQTEIAGEGELESSSPVYQIQVSDLVAAEASSAVSAPPPKLTRAQRYAATDEVPAFTFEDDLQEPARGVERPRVAP